MKPVDISLFLERRRFLKKLATVFMSHTLMKGAYFSCDFNYKQSYTLTECEWGGSSLREAHRLVDCLACLFVTWVTFLSESFMVINPTQDLDKILFSHPP